MVRGFTAPKLQLALEFVLAPPPQRQQPAAGQQEPLLEAAGTLRQISTVSGDSILREWSKEWVLGCVIPLATRPKARIFDHACTDIQDTEK